MLQSKQRINIFVLSIVWCMCMISFCLDFSFHSLYIVFITVVSFVCRSSYLLLLLLLHVLFA